LTADLKGKLKDKPAGKQISGSLLINFPDKVSCSAPYRSKLSKRVENYFNRKLASSFGEIFYVLDPS
jgi:hypothetical protein